MWESGTFDALGGERQGFPEVFGGALELSFFFRQHHIE